MRFSKLFFATLLACLLGLTAVAGNVGVSAQEATPEGDCRAYTEDELVAIAESYFAAIEAEDIETIDALLHEDVTHNQTDLTGGTNDPGNEDELQQLEATGTVDYTIEATFVDEDTVIIRYTFSIDDVYGESVEATGLSVFRFECGQIIEMYQESTGFGLFLGGVGGDTEGTPAP
jgi:ketosteroid isomerase-like protein